MSSGRRHSGIGKAPKERNTVIVEEREAYRLNRQTVLMDQQIYDRKEKRLKLEAEKTNVVVWSI